ncbi:5-hydroxytryptamine receptor 3B isoform X1 [Rhinoraja longicauda]
MLFIPFTVIEIKQQRLKTQLLRKEMSLPLFFCLISGSVGYGALVQNSTVHQLMETLLLNYDKGIRPVKNWTQPTTIYIDFILHAVLDVDGQNQKLTTSVWYRQLWMDDYLVWNPTRFDEINEISLPVEAIWIPDIIIQEFIDIGNSPHLPYVYVNASGVVKNYKPIQVVSACNLQIYAFPFDQQNCSFTFGSWMHTVNDVNLKFWRSRAEVENDTRAFLSDSEWELLSVPSKYERLHAEGDDYAQIQFNVVIRRRPLFYMVSLLLPSMFLMLVDVTSYFLPPNSSGRITFKSSILLGYTVFRINLHNQLAVTALHTPLIGVFFVVCMALLVVSLAESIFIVHLVNLNEDAEPICFTAINGLSRQSTNESLCPPLEARGGSSDDRLSESDLEPDVQQEEEYLETESRGLQRKRLPLEELQDEISSIKLCLHNLDVDSNPKNEWLAFCYRLDRFLFLMYLVVLAVYTVTMTTLWLIWSYP